jgi:hypothetical protein
LRKGTRVNRRAALIRRLSESPVRRFAGIAGALDNDNRSVRRGGQRPSGTTRWHGKAEKSTIPLAKDSLEPLSGVNDKCPPPKAGWGNLAGQKLADAAFRFLNPPQTQTFKTLCRGCERSNTEAPLPRLDAFLSG